MAGKLSSNHGSNLRTQSGKSPREGTCRLCLMLDVSCLSVVLVLAGIIYRLCCHSLICGIFRLGIISSLMEHVVETTLVFLEQHCKTVLTADFGSTVPSPSPARGVYEVQSILRYLTVIFDRHILRGEDDSSQVVEQQQKGRISVAGSSHSRHSSGITPGDTDKVISTFVFAFVWAFGGHLKDRLVDYNIQQKSSIKCFVF